MKPKRFRKLRVTHVSLVRRGATKMRATFKDVEGKVAVSLPTLVVKTAACEKLLEDEGILTSIVYAPNRVDSQGDMASREVIRDAAHNWLARGGHVDIGHDLEPVGSDRARIAETFIVHKGHPDFLGITDEDDHEIDIDGAWATRIKLLDPKLKAMAKSGEIGATSLFGTAEYEPDVKPASSSIEEAFADFLAKFDRREDDTENDMNADELKKALKESNDSLVLAMTTTLKEAIAPSAKPPGDKEPSRKVVEFKGDPRDLAAVRKHYDAVRFAQIDMNDPEAVKALVEELEAEKADDKDDKSKGKKAKKSDESPDVAELRRRLAIAEGKSKIRNTGDGNEEDQDERETAIQENIQKARDSVRKLYGLKDAS